MSIELKLFFFVVATDTFFEFVFDEKYLKNKNRKNMNLTEGLNLDEEKRIRRLLDEYLLSQENDVNQDERKAALMRLRAKLNLRDIKRSQHIKLFDIDSYTNELIDREQLRRKQHASTTSTSVKENESNQPDVIFEYKTLKTSAYSNDSSSTPEVIEITRVLDRFKREKPTYIVTHSSAHDSRVSFLDRIPIGMVESRNDDIKCLLSPFTNKSVLVLS